MIKDALRLGAIGFDAVKHLVQSKAYFLVASEKNNNVLPILLTVLSVTLWV